MERQAPFLQVYIFRGKRFTKHLYLDFKKFRCTSSGFTFIKYKFCIDDICSVLRKVSTTCHSCASKLLENSATYCEVDSHTAYYSIKKKGKKEEKKKEILSSAGRVDVAMCVLMRALTHTRFILEQLRWSDAFRN